MTVPPMALGTSSVEGETVFADVDGGGQFIFYSNVSGKKLNNLVLYIPKPLEDAEFRADTSIRRNMMRMVFSFQVIWV